jgi:hypothetical protein
MDSVLRWRNCCQSFRHSRKRRVVNVAVSMAEEARMFGGTFFAPSSSPAHVIAWALGALGKGPWKSHSMLSMLMYILDYNVPHGVKEKNACNFLSASCAQIVRPGAAYRSQLQRSAFSSSAASAASSPKHSHDRSSPEAPCS